MYKERELNEMRHTARRESLEGKPQVRNEEEEKKEWIGQNGEKRKERKVNVVYSGRQEERREKQRKPSMGAFGRQGTSVEGDLCFLGPPAPALHFFREAKSHPLLPMDSR